jgi:signal transduction histidine kinase
MSEAILQLKREFVRYVSHEIRSPLNVVHAGLELLRADLVATGALPSTLSLLQDIYLSSGAAIEILNDMLQYEHIDSGTFKLECAAIALVQAFTGRMNSLKILATSRNIILTIEDQAQVSEFYSPVEDSSLGMLLLLPPTAPLVLFIDRFRVEQIIRNLMTNALKFTPEGGSVTIRFQICPEDIHQQQQQQLEALTPESVAGFLAGTLAVTTQFFRIEVQDSGVGDILCQIISIAIEYFACIHTYVSPFLLCTSPVCIYS